MSRTTLKLPDIKSPTNDTTTSITTTILSPLSSSNNENINYNSMNTGNQNVEFIILSNQIKDISNNYYKLENLYNTLNISLKDEQFKSSKLQSQCDTFGNYINEISNIANVQVASLIDRVRILESANRITTDNQRSMISNLDPKELTKMVYNLQDKYDKELNNYKNEIEILKKQYLNINNSFAEVNNSINVIPNRLIDRVDSHIEDNSKLLSNRILKIESNLLEQNSKISGINHIVDTINSFKTQSNLTVSQEFKNLPTSIMSDNTYGIITKWLEAAIADKEKQAFIKDDLFESRLSTIESQLTQFGFKRASDSQESSITLEKKIEDVKELCRQSVYTTEEKLAQYLNKQKNYVKKLEDTIAETISKTETTFEEKLTLSHQNQLKTMHNLNSKLDQQIQEDIKKYEAILKTEIRARLKDKDVLELCYKTLAEHSANNDAHDNLRSSISNRINELEIAFNNQFTSQIDKNSNFDNQVEEIKAFMIVLKDTLAKKYRTFKAEQSEEMNKFEQLINQTFADFQVQIKNSLQKQNEELNMKINNSNSDHSSTLKAETSKIYQNIQINEISFENKINEVSANFERKYDTLLDNENQLCKSVTESMDTLETTMNKKIQDHEDLVNSKELQLSTALRDEISTVQSNLQSSFEFVDNNISTLTTQLNLKLDQVDNENIESVLSDYINQICIISAENTFDEELNEVRKDIEYQYNQNNECHSELEGKLANQDDSIKLLNRNIEQSIEISKQEVVRVEEVVKSSFEFVDKNLSIFSNQVACKLDELFDKNIEIEISSVLNELANSTEQISFQEDMNERIQTFNHDIEYKFEINQNSIATLDNKVILQGEDSKLSMKQIEADMQSSFEFIDKNVSKLQESIVQKFETTDKELVEIVLNSYIEKSCLTIAEEDLQTNFESLSTALTVLGANLNQDKESAGVLIEEKVSLMNKKIINLEIELDESKISNFLNELIYQIDSNCKDDENSNFINLNFSNIQSTIEKLETDMNFNQEDLFNRTQDLMSSQSKIFERKIDNIDIVTPEVNFFLANLILNICEQFEVDNTNISLKLMEDLKISNAEFKSSILNLERKLNETQDAKPGETVDIEELQLLKNNMNLITEEITKINEEIYEFKNAPIIQPKNSENDIKMDSIQNEIIRISSEVKEIQNSSAVGTSENSKNEIEKINATISGIKDDIHHVRNELNDVISKSNDPTTQVNVNSSLAEGSLLLIQEDINFLKLELKSLSEKCSSKPNLDSGDSSMYEINIESLKRGIMDHSEKLEIIESKIGAIQIKSIAVDELENLKSELKLLSDSMSALQNHESSITSNENLKNDLLLNAEKITLLENKISEIKDNDLKNIEFEVEKIQNKLKESNASNDKETANSPTEEKYPPDHI